MRERNHMDGIYQIRVVTRQWCRKARKDSRRKKKEVKSYRTHWNLDETEIELLGVERILGSERVAGHGPVAAIVDSS